MSTWVTDGIVRLPSRTWATSSMYGLSQSISNHSEALSASTEGANGRKPSRNLIFMLSVSRILGSRGSARMLRAAQRARPELHAPLEPADHVALGDELRRALDELGVRTASRT